MNALVCHDCGRVTISSRIIVLSPGDERCHCMIDNSKEVVPLNGAAVIESEEDM